MRESQLRSRVRNGKTRFYASVNGEQVQLGTKKGAAEKKLKELLNGRPKQIGPNPRVEELIDKFLTWSAKNNEPGSRAMARLPKTQLHESCGTHPGTCRKRGRRSLQKHNPQPKCPCAAVE
jgi:hypothetical protein